MAWPPPWGSSEGAVAARAAPESPSSLQLWVPHSPLRGWALLKDSPRRERRRVTCNHVRFTCSLAHPEAPGTSDKQAPEEGGVLPLPDPGFLRGICTAETTFLQQRSSGGVQGRTSQLCPAWGGSGDPDVELGSFSKLEKVINEIWPLPAPYVLF